VLKKTVEPKHDAERSDAVAEEERLRTQVKRLIRELDNQDREFQQKEDVLKQVVTLLMALSKTGVEEKLLPLLDRLRDALKQGVHKPTLERLLADIRGQVAQQEQPQASDKVARPAPELVRKEGVPVAPQQSAHVSPQEITQGNSPEWSKTQHSVTTHPLPTPSARPDSAPSSSPSVASAPTEAGASRFWGSWRKGATTGSPHVPVAELEQALRGVLEPAIEHLCIDGQQTLNERIAHIKASLQGENLILRLPAVRDRLQALLAFYRQIHETQRAKTEEVLQEVARKLAEVEKSVITGLSEHHKESIIDNSQFVDRIESHVVDMQEAAQLTDLTAIQRLIADRAERMYVAVQAKREFDEKQTAAFAATIQQLEHQLRDAHQQIDGLARRAYYDVLLDGVYNRLAYKEKLEQAAAQFQRYRHPFSLLLLDVDHFKQVNDMYGHQAGDQVLKTLATRIKYLLRAGDFFARYGGDELVLILPYTSLSGAVLVAERLCNLVRKTVFSAGDCPLQITLSIGIATVCGDDTAEALTARADQALYLAKAQGRDQFRTEQELPAPSPAPFKLSGMLGLLGRVRPGKQSVTAPH
jgi:diguanylate cyclase (GGDEF)-like protein